MHLVGEKFKVVKANILTTSYPCKPERVEGKKHTQTKQTNEQSNHIPKRKKLETKKHIWDDAY